MGVAGLVSLTIAPAARASGSFAGLIFPASFAAASLLLSVVSYVYTTRRGRFEVWACLLRSLRLRGDEHVVDLGCGVAERVQLETADLRELPFEDASFDRALSGLAIHNISSAEGRAAAIDEAVRGLKPGGRLAIADIRFVRYTQAG